MGDRYPVRNRGGLVGIAEISQELPEVNESEDFFAPMLVTGLDH